MFRGNCIITDDDFLSELVISLFINAQNNRSNVTRDYIGYQSQICQSGQGFTRETCSRIEGPNSRIEVIEYTEWITPVPLWRFRLSS